MLKNLKQVLFGVAMVGTLAAALSPLSTTQAQETIVPATVFPGVWAVGIDDDNCSNAEKWFIASSDGQLVAVGGADVVRQSWEIVDGELTILPTYGLHRDRETGDWQPSSLRVGGQIAVPIRTIDSDHLQITNKNSEDVTLFRCAPPADSH